MEKSQLLDIIVKLKDSLFMFKDVPDHQIRSIVKNAKFFKYKADELIIKEGTRSEFIYIIISGSCRVLKDESQVAILDHGHVFGEHAALTHEKRNATIITNEDSTILSFKIDFQILDSLFKGYATIYNNIIKELISKINAQNEQLMQK